MGPDLALALHTSSPDLAMALAPFPWSGDGPLSLSCKATGKGLANVLHQELQTLLPVSQCPSVPVASAGGPGSGHWTRGLHR